MTAVAICKTQWFFETVENKHLWLAAPQEEVKLLSSSPCLTYICPVLPSSSAEVRPKRYPPRSKEARSDILHNESLFGNIRIISSYNFCLRTASSKHDNYQFVPLCTGLISAELTTSQQLQPQKAAPRCPVASLSLQ